MVTLACVQRIVVGDRAALPNWVERPDDSGAVSMQLERACHLAKSPQFVLAMNRLHL